MGRTDDMLIIRGVNVFPSQIETVLLNEGYEPNYQIIVDRVKNNDTFDVNVGTIESIKIKPILLTYSFCCYT